METRDLLYLDASGTLCQACGKRYHVDLLIPDPLWKIVSGGHNLLCGECIMERIESAAVDDRIFNVYTLQEEE